MASEAFRPPPVLTASWPRRLRPLWSIGLAILSGCASRVEPPTVAPPVVILGEEITAEGGVIASERLSSIDRGLLGSVQYDLPIVANNWVEKELDFLINERKETVDRWIDRGDFYRDFIQEVLREEGIPTDLYHLAMIESGFVTSAKSRVGATGMWQFMPGTAKDVGLRIDASVDERLDPIRSTRAAARHLRHLYNVHKDWALAAAAYNAGSGRISRGLAAFGATDFWELAERGDLAEETRQYVPRLYAVTILARDRERFGLRPAARVEGLSFDSIYVEYETPLAALAALGPATADQLAALNPHLLQGTTPAGGYWVWVPSGAGQQMQRTYLVSNIRAEQGLGSYTVRWGDTLGRLAQLSGVPSARIRELNPGVDFDRLITGSKLRLPNSAAEQLAARPEVRPEAPAQAEAEQSTLVAAATAAPARPREEVSAAPGQPLEHKVEAGETLWGIARKYGVSLDVLATENGIAGSKIVPGQRLTIPAERSAVEDEEVAPLEHVVEWGDTLWGIARKYGSSIEAIEAANQLGDRPVRPGQVLTVPRTD